LQGFNIKLNFWKQQGSRWRWRN